MGAIRIRWRALGKVAAIAVAAVAVLQALPKLLQPPAPAPLARDVGLQGIEVERRPAKRVEFLSHTESKSPRRRPRASLPPDVISSVPHRRAKPQKTREASQPQPRRNSPKPSGSSPPAASPTPESPPPATASPVPIEAPPPPEPPSDGSEEFAPH